jgi:hypothetical protein
LGHQVVLLIGLGKFFQKHGNLLVLEKLFKI